MTEVYMEITGAVATARKVGPLTAGMVGVPVMFSFSPEWQELNLLAVFRAGEEKKDNEIKAGRSVIPSEVLTQPGQMLCIGVEGRSKDGALVIPTVWAEVGRILDGAQAANDPALAPTPTQFERFMAGLEQVDEKLLESLRQAKESGEFHGTSVTHRWEGSVLSVTSASGTSKANLKGEPGYTPVKGVDYFTEAEKQAWESMAADAVRYTSQNLTDVQKSQARENIGVEFGDKVVLEELLALTDAALDVRPSHYPETYFPKIDIVVGETYVVHFNGQEYELVAYGDEWAQMIGRMPSQTPFVFGNAKLSSSPDETCLQTIQGIEIVTVSVHRKVTIAEKIDPRFFPEEALLATPQSLSEAQKAQARENLGIGDLGGADWNASEGEPGYVANRTHWVEDGAVILPECQPVFMDDEGVFMAEGVTAIPNAGGECTVNWNGTQYTCTVQDASSIRAGAVALGNASAFGLQETADPFAILLGEEDGQKLGGILPLDGTTELIVSITGETVHKLDPKFLPDNIGGGNIYTAVFDIRSSDDGLTVTAKQPFSEVYAKATDGSTFVRGFANVYFYNQDTPVGTQQLFYTAEGDNGAGGKSLAFLMLMSDNEGGVQCAEIRFYSDESVIITGM